MLGGTRDLGVPGALLLLLLVDAADWLAEEEVEIPRLCLLTAAMEGSGGATVLFLDASVCSRKPPVRPWLTKDALKFCVFSRDSW